MTFDHLTNCFWLNLIFIFLYAEIHYRIPGLFSRYFRKEPEIIADIPHRLDPEQPLPILILIKDAHLFPVILLQITAVLYHDNQQFEILKNNPGNLLIDKSLWYKLFNVNLPELSKNSARIDVIISYEINGKIKTIHNDNYALTTQHPFEIIIDRDPLPGKENWYFGDLHYHSFYSNDQVEFGAPLDVTKQIAKTMGIDFFAVTDHSYDLDDFPDNYLQNDPLLSKWFIMWDTVTTINKEEKSFIIIPGEELSAGNVKNQNIHFLLLNNHDFFHGSGDSAEKWFRIKPEWQIHNVIPKLRATGLAIAAHPETNPPLLQRFLINRGKWLEKDYMVKGLHGIQMWNGVKNHFLKRGIKKWVMLLLKGKRLSLFAGNDAHGNFNRFRQLGTPFLTMRENTHEIFAKARTGVYIEKDFSLNNLVDSIRNGRVIVTDGPFAEILIKNNSGAKSKIGDCYPEKSGSVQITAKSSPTFGFFKSIELFAGDITRRKESKIYTFTPETERFNFNLDIKTDNLPDKGYIRLMAVSEKKNIAYHCFTNPVYIEHN